MSVRKNIVFRSTLNKNNLPASIIGALPRTQYCYHFQTHKGKNTLQQTLTARISGVRSPLARIVDLWFSLSCVTGLAQTPLAGRRARRLIGSIDTSCSHRPTEWGGRHLHGHQPLQVTLTHRWGVPAGLVRLLVQARADRCQCLGLPARLYV